MNKKVEEQKNIDFQIGRYELFFKKGYKIFDVINEFMIGIWYLSGSVLFLLEYKTLGIWLFVIGSIQILIRPSIRLIHDIHLRKFFKNQENNNT